jgi:chromosome segregation ATPase
MWICPNCETANNSRKKKCAVCDTEKPFSNENPNSASILKSKIQELEEQVLALNEERNLLSINKSELQKELSKINYTLNATSKEKEDLKKQLDKVKSDKALIENRLKQIENEKSSLSTSLSSTKTELENQVKNLQNEVQQLKQSDNTGCLGIIIVALIISLLVSMVTCSNRKNSNNSNIFLNQLREITLAPFIIKKLDNVGCVVRSSSYAQA